MIRTTLAITLVGILLLGAACQKPPATTNQPLKNTPTVNLESEPVLVTTYQGDLTSQVNHEVIALTGWGTQGLDIDPATGLVYLGNNGSVVSKCTQIDQLAEGRNTLSVVDPVQKKETARVDTDGGPIWPTVDVARDVVYVANSAGTVSVHKRGSGEKIQSIQLNGLPHMMGIDGNLGVVSNTFNQTQTYYSVIDLTTRQVVGNYTSPRLPHPIVIDADQHLAYMMGVEDASVAVIDMTTGKTKETFKFSGGGGQLWMSKKFNKFYNSSSQPGTAAAAHDLTTKQAAGTVGFPDINQPGTSIVVDEDAGLLYVVIGDGNALGIADAQTMQPLGHIKVGGCPYGVRLDLTRGKGYVSNSGDHSLSMFDLAKVREVLGR